MRSVAALTFVAAVPALLGGVLYWAIAGGTLATRAIAYGFWFAAAVLLVGMIVSAQRAVWRRVSFHPPEGWVFLWAATALTAVGVAIDVAGS